MMVELGHTISLWVFYKIAKNGGFVVLFGIYYCGAQYLGKPLSVEYIIAQYEANSIVAHKLFANGEGLCQSVGAGLLGILEGNAIVWAIAQQAFKPG